MRHEKQTLNTKFQYVLMYSLQELQNDMPITPHQGYFSQGDKWEAKISCWAEPEV